MNMKLRSILLLALVLAGSPALAQVNQGTSPLSGAKGGTNNGFMQFTGPAGSLKTYSVPNTNGTIPEITGAITSGNFPSFNGTTGLLQDSGVSAASIAGCTGAGAFLVGTGSAAQCSTVAGSNPIVNGLLAINTNALALPSGASGTLLQLGAVDNSNGFIYYDAFGVSGSHNSTPHIIFRTNRGTNASPLPVGSAIDNTPALAGTPGDYYGALFGLGYQNGGAYESIAPTAIAFRPTQLQTPTAQGSRVQIAITQNNSATGYYAFTFDQSGTFIVNNTLTLAPPTPAATAVLTTIQTVGALGTQAWEMDSVNGANFIFGVRADGTLGANTAVGSAKGVLQFGALAFDGTQNNTILSVDALTVNAQVHSSDNSSRLRIRTIPSGSTTLAEHFSFGAGFSAGTGGIDPGPGVGNFDVGVRIGNAATSGNVLRGNGTNFVSAQLACSDLSGVGTGCAGTSFSNLTGAVTSVGAATSLGSFSSANLAAALTDETGTGAAVFASSPIFAGAVAMPDSATWSAIGISGLTNLGATKVTSPLHIGGSGTTGTQLTFQSTTGVGTTDGFLWTRGNNGATTAMALNNTGLGLGTVAPDAFLSVNANTAASVAPPANTTLHLVGANSTNSRIAMDSYAGINVFSARRADGTQASPTQVVANDILFLFGAAGYTSGSAYSAGQSQIQFIAAESFTAGAQGSFLSFLTVATGTTAAVQGMQLEASGGLNLGVTNAVLAASEFGMNKISASGSAPGAGTVKIAAVAGTTGGTCKLISYAGTSTTPTTILDNIGSGC
jgi:hypothetical protein